MSRSTLTDPRPGDVVKKGNLTRRVTGVDGYEITWYREGAYSNMRRDCWISTWREWCRNAEVIHAAD